MELPTKFFRDKIWVSIVIPIVAIPVLIAANEKRKFKDAFKYKSAAPTLSLMENI